MLAMVLPSYCSGPAWSGIQVSASSSGNDNNRARVCPTSIRIVGCRVFLPAPLDTTVHTPPRVDTSDHLSASADTIWMYDSTGSGPLLTTDSVSWNRPRGSATIVGRAGSGGGLRGSGKFSSRGAGARRNRLPAHHRPRLRGIEQFAAPVVVR